MNWGDMEIEKNDGFAANRKLKIPNQWIHSHYYEIFNILFRIENSLRIFVYIILKEQYQDSWDSIQITSDDNEKGTISSIAKRRMSQDEDYGYLGYSVTCPIMYLTSGELISIIVSDSYWKFFNDYFNCKRKLVKTKLDEISNVRNALAHFRPMKKEDVELVKHNGNHILNSVDKGLLNIFQITDIVPTNTQENWYESLSNIENEYCNLFFYQSSDEKWIKIDINYHCSNISKENTIFNNKQYKVLNIVSPNILSKFPIYKDKLIFISESVSSNMKENDLEVFKDISFVFSRSVLKTYNKKILSDFQKLLNIISKETNLIKEDHLARGDLIVSSQINVYKKDNGNWNIRDENLKYNTDESTLTEYWGDFNIYSDDFISTTYNYPWMPVSTSDFVFPF